MADNIKNREIIKKIKVNKQCTYFVQALLEDTGIVAVSLGGKESLTLFYDSEVEEEVNFFLQKIFEFCSIEFSQKRL